MSGKRKRSDSYDESTDNEDDGLGFKVHHNTSGNISEELASAEINDIIFVNTGNQQEMQIFKVNKSSEGVKDAKLIYDYNGEQDRVRSNNEIENHVIEEGADFKEAVENAKYGDTIEIHTKAQGNSRTKYKVVFDFEKYEKTVKKLETESDEIIERGGKKRKSKKQRKSMKQRKSKKQRKTRKTRKSKK